MKGILSPLSPLPWEGTTTVTFCARVEPGSHRRTLSLALDLANLRELPLALPGVELEGVRVQRAALQQMVVARLQQRLFGIAVSVLRSSGVFGSASKIFAAASHGVSALTDSPQAAQAARRSDVAHVGEGFSEGGRAFGQNILRGATGVFTKPMEGAGKGFGGFLGGMAKGLVGAAASPIGGALAAASKTWFEMCNLDASPVGRALAAASKVTEGMDAQYRMLYGTRQTNRKRLPRPFTGDPMLCRVCLHPVLGQALLPVASHALLSLSGPLHLTFEIAFSPFNQLSQRLALCCRLTGDRMLRPFSLHPALGQALLHRAVLPESVASAMTVGLSRHLLSRVVGTGNRCQLMVCTRSNSIQHRQADNVHEVQCKPVVRCKWHVCLGQDTYWCLADAQFGATRKLTCTHMLHHIEHTCAPMPADFVALQLRVMSGELAHVTEVPGGVVVWELRYKSMLTAELAWHQQTRGVPPDGVLVHRKARSQRDGMLVYDVRCSQRDGMLVCDVQCRCVHKCESVVECDGVVLVKCTVRSQRGGMLVCNVRCRCMQTCTLLKLRAPWSSCAHVPPMLPASELNLHQAQELLQAMNATRCFCYDIRVCATNAACELVQLAPSPGAAAGHQCHMLALLRQKSHSHQAPELLRAINISATIQVCVRSMLPARRPHSHQAQELLQAINATRRRYDKRSSQAAAELKSKQMLPAVSDAGQQLPETTLSVDFKPVWVALRRTANGAQVVCCSIWRPIGPPGYAMLGDVAERGADRPYQPVRMYRDTAPTDDTEGEDEAHPRLAPPVGYALVFRDSAHPPATLWRPLPPRGYTEVGCVAWPEMEEPPISLVRCIRSDLAAPAKVYEAPLWQGVSSDNQFWVGSIWLVDSHLSTFLANKSSSRPPAMPRVPRY
ncbi:hypothetical protein DUNSADRAFT_14358 [Dunaliella salina]|uniref:Vacuolar protein sorting-associated protein 13 DH-like domain-containing protein n=1 Tax=Dunaliella salina TaxID=3046 RepID=A0ABQ7G7H9_DUNSA|nr:hypothetical protein DUNSADRAFT_14358 [Dunaliella salina]|eukprot:KAF5830551.1 hypothetical protein DUNSADRAFT_14358 [Dunaliella salina]